MKGLVCLALRTCADGMWYYVMITMHTIQIHIPFFALVSDESPVTASAKIPLYVSNVLIGLFIYLLLNLILIIWHKYEMLGKPDP